MGKYSESDAKYRSTKPIDAWEVVKMPHSVSGVMQFRISVTYPNGDVRTMACAFANRRSMDDYIDRWLPTFVGKEKIVVAAKMICLSKDADRGDNPLKPKSTQRG
jgi:hypothetical protein